MAVIQKKFVAMDINHGYKQYLFGQILAKVKIKGRIHHSKHHYILIVLNEYFDRLNARFDWKNITYDTLVKKLIVAAEKLIKFEEEKEEEELDIVHLQALFFNKLAI